MLGDIKKWNVKGMIQLGFNYLECSKKKDYFVLAWSYKFATEMG